MFKAAVCPLLSANSCKRTNIGVSPNLIPNSEFTIKSGMQVIIPSYRFRCCGKVAEWKIRVSARSESFSNSVELQIWRSSNPGCYTLVGKNRFINSSSMNEIATLLPLPDHQIQVQRHDVMGLYVYSESSTHGISDGVATTDGSENVWLANRSTLTSPNTTCSKGQYTIIQQAPIITASLGK